MIEDLTWFGINWDEGYNHETSASITDPANQYIQSKRFALYARAWKILYDKGYIYPCRQSRRDVEAALSAPHDTILQRKSVPPSSSSATSNDTTPSDTTTNPTKVERSIEMKKLIEEIPNEAVFPPFLRPPFLADIPYGIGNNHFFPPEFRNLSSPFDMKINWRFRIPDDFRPIQFIDGNLGDQVFFPGEDFGDFLIWRLDGYPSYELAVVVDDILMRITEVVRGQDLLISTARQLLLMHAIFGLDYQNPQAWNDPFGTTVLTGDQEYQKEEELVEEEEKGEIIQEGSKEESEGVVELGKEESPFDRFFSSENDYHIPSYFHLPLVCDENGVRLAKRNFAKSLRKLREEEGMTPIEVREKYFQKKLPI